MSMPSYGQPPESCFFIFEEDDTDRYAVHWRGSEWGTDHQADRRGWYHNPLSPAAYGFLLEHYGLPSDSELFSFDRVRVMSPRELVAARRTLEAESGLPTRPFVEGRDYEGRLVDYVLIAMDDAKRDAEVIGQVNKLGSENNNGRKHCATSVMPQFGEVEITDPHWRVPAVLPTGDGGFEVATLTEFTGQDRHKHQRSTEIYTVLKGEFQIYLDDAGPLTLSPGDEIVILPGTVHEVIHRKRREREAGEDFDLLVRVHAINCQGASDKYVQLEQNGDGLPWSSLEPEQKARAFRKQR